MPPEIHQCSKCDLDFIELNQSSILCFSCRGPDEGDLASNLESELNKLREDLDNIGYYIEISILDEYGSQQRFKLASYDQIKVIKKQ